MSITDFELKKVPKSKLLRMLVYIRDLFVKERQSYQEEVTLLKNIIAEYEKVVGDAKKLEINKSVNQPSSKKAEWDKDKPKPKKKTPKKEERSQRGW